MSKCIGMFRVRRVPVLAALAAILGTFAMPAYATPAVRATLALPAQSIVELRTTSSWDLRRSDNFRITGGRGSWATASLTARLAPDSFPAPAPSWHWVSRDSYCPLSGCSGARDFEQANALHTLRPGTYFAIAVGAPGQVLHLRLGGFSGRVVSIKALQGRNDVARCDGAGVDAHRVLIDCGYNIVKPRAHLLKGYVYVAALQGPGTEALASCANNRTEVRPLAGPNSCLGFAFLLGPGVAEGVGVSVHGWYSLGNVDSGGSDGDGHYYAAAAAMESHVTLMTWAVELPF